MLFPFQRIFLPEIPYVDLGNRISVVINNSYRPGWRYANRKRIKTEEKSSRENTVIRLSHPVRITFFARSNVTQLTTAFPPVGLFQAQLVRKGFLNSYALAERDTTDSEAKVAA